MIAILLALTAAVGCIAARPPVVQCRFPRSEAPSGPALVSQHYGQISPIPLDAVQFTDPWLTSRLAVQSLRTSRTEDDLLRVSARVVNCLDQALAFNARVNFLTADQADAEPPSSWQTVVVQPYSMATFAESSISPSAEAFMIELRGDGYAGTRP